jgi:cytochrome c-type biogenesis protein CcmH/NrfG
MLGRADRLENRFSPQEVRQANAFNWAALGTVLSLNGSAALARQAFRSSIHYAPTRLRTYLRYAASYLPAAAYRRTL